MFLNKFLIDNELTDSIQNYHIHANKTLYYNIFINLYLKLLI